MDFKGWSLLKSDDVDDSKNVIWKCMQPRVSAIIFQIFKVITLATCVRTILELNWNRRFRNKTTKLNICQHTLTSSTQQQNKSFHLVERTTTSARCPKIKNKWIKNCKVTEKKIKKMQSVQNYCFILSDMQICDIHVLVAVFLMVA